MYSCKESITNGNKGQREYIIDKLVVIFNYQDGILETYTVIMKVFTKWEQNHSFSKRTNILFLL